LAVVAAQADAAGGMDAMNAGGRFSQLEVGPARAEPSSGGRSNDPATGRKASAGPRRGARELLAEADRLAQDGAEEKALAAYSAALVENPLLVEAWAGQLMMLLQLDEDREARLWADKALESFPDHPDLLAFKALALYRLGLHGDAYRMADAAVARRQDSEHVWRSRAVIVMRRSKAAAKGCLAKSLEYAKSSGAARLRIGRVLLDAGQYREAVEYLSRATEELPKAAAAWHGLGRALEGMGWIGDARDAFQTAARLAPDDARYAEALERCGHGWRAWLRALWRRRR